MLLLGYELQDVLQVVVGIALGLLTVYRRELSCNRGYHPEDEHEDGLGESVHRRLLQAGMLRERGGSSSLFRDDECGGNGNDIPSKLIRRRKSSSSLPNMTSFHSHEDGARHDPEDHINSEDPTEELLESAGLFLSGGPFLAAAIAVFDHLFFTNFLSAFYSASSLLRNSNTNKDDRSGIPCGEERILQSRDGEKEATRQQNQQHLYSVAWNAATEYYTSISAKLDCFPVSSGGGGHPMLHARSKSTGNIQKHLSDERSRALLRDMLAMANRGGMDVTLLPGDAQIVIFSYLPPKDVLAFTCTNRAGRNLLEDASDIGDAEALATTTMAEDEDDGTRTGVNDGDTAMLIWKALFQRDYSWVLSDWKIGKEAFLRSMTQQEHQGLAHMQQRRQHSPKSAKVFHHVVSTILDSEHDASNELPVGNTTSSMKEFYFTFTETWLNYTIAGCNSNARCLIGLHGHVFDISNFVDDHPGSTETLLLQAGRDATVFFESMGHSLGARKLATGMCAVVNGQCARWQFASEEGRNNDPSFQLRPGPLGPLFSDWGLIKPTCKSLDVKRNITGFLIPRKRSRPRFQGGLHRVRERIRREEEVQLEGAARWGRESIGANGMFGGIQVYHDPFCGWRWWYTDRDFNAIYTAPSPS